jgi:hypothetical protein
MKDVSSREAKGLAERQELPESGRKIAFFSAQPQILPLSAVPRTARFCRKSSDPFRLRQRHLKT